MKTLLIGLALFALPLLVSAQDMKPLDHILTVTGSAEVSAAPDEATVRLGVSEMAPTAQEAQSKANAVINAFLKKLQALGIDKKDIQTSQMSLQPQYQYPQTGGSPKLTGYTAADVLTVRLSDFDKIGDVIDAGTAVGVNTIQGINFGLRNDAAAQAEAYRQAVADARAKAEAIAGALNMKITGVFDVTAGGGAPQPIYYGRMDKAMAAGTPVEPGQVQVGVSLTIRYRIG